MIALGCILALGLYAADESSCHAYRDDFGEFQMNSRIYDARVSRKARPTAVSNARRSSFLMKSGQVSKFLMARSNISNLCVTSSRLEPLCRVQSDLGQTWREQAYHIGLKTLLGRLNLGSPGSFKEIDHSRRCLWGYSCNQPSCHYLSCRQNYHQSGGILQRATLQSIITVHQ